MVGLGFREGSKAGFIQRDTSDSNNGYSLVMNDIHCILKGHTPLFPI